MICPAFCSVANKSYISKFCTGWPWIITTWAPAATFIQVVTITVGMIYRTLYTAHNFVLYIFNYIFIQQSFYQINHSIIVNIGVQGYKSRTCLCGKWIIFSNIDAVVSLYSILKNVQYKIKLELILTNIMYFNLTRTFEINTNI